MEDGGLTEVQTLVEQGLYMSMSERSHCPAVTGCSHQAPASSSRCLRALACKCFDKVRARGVAADGGAA